MRMIKPTSTAIALGIAASMAMTALKAFSAGISDRLSWWIATLPLTIIALGIAAYASWYMLSILYKRRKYQRQRDKSSIK